MRENATKSRLAVAPGAEWSRIYKDSRVDEDIRDFRPCLHGKSLKPRMSNGKPQDANLPRGQ
jgi:hypothetical protein